MLRRTKDMPTGRIAFEAIGEVEDDDWEQTVEPVLRDEMADGHKIWLLSLPPVGRGSRRRRATQ